MGQRLLIVDGDRRFLQDHQTALESTFEVDVLHASEGALAQLESGQYAAVLLCVEVSENKGYSLCSAIRRAPGLQELKVALISGKATEEEYARHRSLKGRADLYLHKPIQTQALMAALTPIVPLKSVDPDNPLGDIGGTDLGDEWLDSLRSELEGEEVLATGFALTPQPPQTIAPPPPPDPRPAPPAPAAFALPPLPPLAPLPLSHQATQRLPTIPKDAGRVELLEARVKDLEAKLVAKADQLDEHLQELTDLRHDHNVATRNLDDLEQRQAQAVLLQAKLQETQETLTAQAAQGEAAAAALEAELQAALAEQQLLRDQNGVLTGQLAATAQQTLEITESNQLLQAQLEEAREFTAEAARTRDALTGALEASRHTAQQENEDLQRRLEEALRSAREDKLALERRLNEQTDEMRELEQRHAQQELTARQMTAACEECRAARKGLETAFNELEAQVATMAANHEQQQMELLAGIDEREAQLGRLHAALDAEREQALGLERQKAELERQKADLDRHLLAQTDRMAAVQDRLADLQDKTSQALELAKAPTL